MGIIQAWNNLGDLPLRNLYLLSYNLCMPQSYSEQENQKIKLSFNNGMTVTEIAAMLNRDRNTVSKVLRQFGFDPKNRLQQDDIDNLLKQWENNVPARELIKNFHLSYGKIKEIVIKNGLPTKRVNRLGKNNNMWRGGRIKRSTGYIDVYVEENSPFLSMAHRRDDVKNRAGYIPEHRLVMAKYLGRPLASYETVHHKNGIRDDNRIENLQLRVGKHGPGINLQCQDCGSHNVLAEEI